MIVHGEGPEDQVRAALAEVSFLVDGACGGEETTS